MPVPELPWETKCIEAPSVIKRGGTTVGALEQTDALDPEAAVAQQIGRHRRSVYRQIHRHGGPLLSLWTQ